MTGWNLPPGVSQADIDAHFGDDRPEACPMCGRENYDWDEDGFLDEDTYTCGRLVCRFRAQREEARNECWISASYQWERGFDVNPYPRPDDDERRPW